MQSPATLLTIVIKFQNDLIGRKNIVDIFEHIYEVIKLRLLTMDYQSLSLSLTLFDASEGWWQTRSTNSPSNEMHLR